MIFLGAAMTETGSITQMLTRLKAGEEEALVQLHRRYWPVLVELARKRLKDAPRRVEDEEDVAQQTFLGFYNSFKAGRVPRLESRHHLLALLTTITACTAANQIARQMAKRRGGGNVATGSCWTAMAEDAGNSPVQEAILHDLYERFVGGLPERLQGFAEGFLAGCTAKELAERMGCTQRTVERKTALVRQIWQEWANESVNEPVQMAGDRA